MAKRQADRQKFEFENLQTKFLTAEHLSFRVGCRPELFDWILRRLDFPGRTEFIPISGREVFAGVLDQKFDVAIGSEVVDSTEIVASKLLRSKPRLVICKNLLGRLKTAEAAFRDKRFLAETPCIAYQQHGPLMRDWTRYLKTDFESLNIKFMCEDWRIVEKLVVSAKGYAIIPSYIPLSENKSLLAFDLPEAVSPGLQFYILFRRELRQVPAYSKAIRSLSANS